MQEADYREWLNRHYYEENTIKAQIHRVGRVEEYHGDIDNHYATDRMVSLIQLLTYSSEDQRLGRPNPTKIPINGNLRHNLASYRNAIERYREFRDIVLKRNRDALNGWHQLLQGGLPSLSKRR